MKVGVWDWEEHVYIFTAVATPNLVTTAWDQGTEGYVQRLGKPGLGRDFIHGRKILSFFVVMKFLRLLVAQSCTTVLYISSDLRALIPSLWIAQISLAELHAALASAGQLSRCSDGGTTRMIFPTPVRCISGCLKISEISDMSRSSDFLNIWTYKK